MYYIYFIIRKIYSDKMYNILCLKNKKIVIIKRSEFSPSTIREKITSKNKIENEILTRALIQNITSANGQKHKKKYAQSPNFWNIAESVYFIKRKKIYNIYY